MTGGASLKNKKHVHLYLVSIAIIMIGVVEIIFNKATISQEFFNGIFELLVGVILLILAITSHVKFNANRKQLERELSKEYDERDDLIEGKASQFTMTTIIIVALLIMFLSNWMTISTNAALFFIIVFCGVTNWLAKKYYERFL
jgi:membrane protein CcdC involved in cytochrome C biogenesis